MPDVSYIYTVPYFSFYLCSLLLWGVGELSSYKVRRVIADWVLPIAFFMFWGFRGFEATDWKVYCPYFEEALASNALEAGNIEIGFRVLMRLMRSLTSSYWVYQGVLTAVNIVFLKEIFRRYSKSPGLSWVIWFACFPIMHDLQRNFLALLICLYAFRFVERHCFWKYGLLVVLATFFHSSALMFLPLYFVLGRRFPSMFYLCLITVCLVAVIAKVPVLDYLSDLAPFFNRLPDVHLNGTYADSTYKIGKHIFTVLPLAAIGVAQLRNTPRNRMVIAYNLFFLYLICYCILQGNGEIQRRLVMLFEWSVCLVIPWAMSWKKNLIYRSVFVLYILFFCCRHCLCYNNVMWRYENVLFVEPTGFDERWGEIDEVNKSFSTQGQ